MVKVYKLSRATMVFIIAGLGFMTLLGTVATISQMGDSSMGMLGKSFPLLWLFVMGWVWWGYLKIPFEIKIQEDNSIEFHSVLNRIVLSPDKIRCIHGHPLSWGFIKIIHSGGSIQLINQMNNFHDFIQTLRSSNPLIDCKI
jgi:hypothetical protein